MAHAQFGARLASHVVEIADDLRCLDQGGFWAVVVTFEGKITCVRFAQMQTGQIRDLQPRAPQEWASLADDWSSSLDEAAHRRAVTQIRQRIAAGEVYQVCLCRIMSHPLAENADLGDLQNLLALGNPAPHAGRVYIPEAGLDVVCASPEAFLIRSGGRIESRPIKGTATDLSSMQAKDYAENVMIADLVRNDLSAVCRPGTVSVDALCAPQQHPGLTHLVTTVSGQVRQGVGWADVMSATFPPGSVTGAPKSSALRVIADLEDVPRGPYCGAIGWVDADTGQGELAVGIRTFWADRDDTGARWLRFGTGGAITWGSDAVREWAETELKAARLIGLASGKVGL